MKRIATFLLGVLFPIFLLGNNEMDSLLKVLDKTVDNYQLYSDQKEEKLNKLKDLLKITSTDLQKFQICAQLYDEYRSYKSDSALAYARVKLQIAEKLNDIHSLTNARLNLAAIMGLNGLYAEELDILEGIDINQTPELKAYYFHIYRTLYGYMADYTVSSQENKRYNYLTAAYRDSLLVVNPPSSATHIMVKSDQLIVQENYEEALELLINYYPTIKDDQHIKAIIAYSLSLAYHGKKTGCSKKNGWQFQPYMISSRPIKSIFHYEDLPFCFMRMEMLKERISTSGDPWKMLFSAMPA